MTVKQNRQYSSSRRSASTPRVAKAPTHRCCGPSSPRGCTACSTIRRTRSYKRSKRARPSGRRTPNRWQPPSTTRTSSTSKKKRKAFAQLLLFCETYSARYAYDGQAAVAEQPVAVDSDLRGERRARAEPLPPSNGQAELPSRCRRSSRKRNREVTPHSTDTGQDEYVVEALLDVRVSNHGEKQVQVKWEGYHRATWEPYQSMKQQLTEMLVQLESKLARASDEEDEEEEEESAVHAFLVEYIATHKVDRGYRWRPDRLNTLEEAAEGHCPRIRQTGLELRKKTMRMVNGAE